MPSIPSHQYTDALDTRFQSDSRGKSKNGKSALGERLDEIAVFACVAFAMMGIAIATYALFF